MPAIIPHYRVPIYNYLETYLKDYGFSLVVVSDGVQSDNPYAIDFEYIEIPLFDDPNCQIN